MFISVRNRAAFCARFYRTCAPQKTRRADTLQSRNEKRIFISPGQGRALKITSMQFHDGRSLAAVRTEVRNEDGARVLEEVSPHAA
jgi:hypothetical protein